MKKYLLIIALMLSTISFAQMATYDAAASANALNIIEKSTETIDKLNELKATTEKTIDMVTKVSTAISSGNEIKNILKYQRNILSDIDKIRRNAGTLTSIRKQEAFNSLVLDIIEKTNYLILKTNNTITTGSFKMNDFERLTILKEVTEEIETLSNSTRRIAKKISK